MRLLTKTSAPAGTTGYPPDIRHDVYRNIFDMPVLYRQNKVRPVNMP